VPSTAPIQIGASDDQDSGTDLTAEGKVDDGACRTTSWDSAAINSPLSVVVGEVLHFATRCGIPVGGSVG
ncbi:MAG: hypothetical protein PVJ55_11520, partial [Anaerolineae bacterium]